MNVKKNMAHGPYFLAFFIFLLSAKSSGQERSVPYDNIVNNTLLSAIQIEEKVDSLFTAYTNNEQFIPLIQDLRYHANWFYKLKKYDKAIATAKKALRLYENNSGFNEELHSRLLFNLALYHNKKQEYLKAIRKYQKLISLELQNELTAKSYSQIGYNYTKLGDFHNALNFHKKAEELLWKEKSFDAYFRDRLYAANACRLLNERKTIITGVKNLLKTKHLNDSLKGKVKDRSFAIYKSLAQLLHGEKTIKNAESALAYYHKALNIAIEENSTSKIASTYNDIGALYIDKKGYVLANTFYTKALEYSGDNSDILSYIYYSQSLLAATENQYKRALDLSQKAIAAATGLVDVENIDQKSLEAYDNSYNKNHLLTLLKERGTLWMKYYEVDPSKSYLENAFQLFSSCDKLIDIIRFQSIEQESKLFWRKEGAEIYYKAVAVSQKLDKIDQAFYFMEKNKAILLLEDIAYERRKSSATVPDSLITLEYHLKSDILWEEGELAYTISVTAQDSIKTVLASKKRAYTTFINQLQFQYPDYYYLKKTAKITALQSSAKEGTFIEYIIPSADQNAKGFGLFSTKGQQIVFELPETVTLNSKINEFKKNISRPFISKEELEHFRKNSAELYAMLIPVHIRPLLLNKTITIIPDGSLQNIPFEALVTNSTSGSYFLESNPIHYVYSMSFLEESKTANRKAEKIYGGFAPFAFGYDNLPPLKNSIDEINAIQGLLGGDSYTNKSARFKDFITKSKQYKILHLATHADAIDSISPWVAFEDQKMSLNDLYTVKTQADLVVLSACNTSLGELKTGEGVMSLARGFFNSGSKSVLSSLWTINDRSSKTLMEDFYSNLKQGSTKTDALHQAKLKYLKNHDLMEASPYYWASFVLIGDGGELMLPKTNWSLIIGITILIGITLMLLFVYSKNRKAQR